MGWGGLRSIPQLVPKFCLVSCLFFYGAVMVLKLGVPNWMQTVCTHLKEGSRSGQNLGKKYCDTKKSKKSRKIIRDKLIRVSGSPQNETAGQVQGTTAVRLSLLLSLLPVSSLLLLLFVCQHRHTQRSISPPLC